MRDVRSGARVCLLVTLVLLAGSSLAFGKTINVMPGKATGIGAALAAANPGDVVLVGCGVYQESGLVMPEGVTLAGTSINPGCVVIEGDGLEPVIIAVDVGPATQIMNLTLTVDYTGGEDESLKGAGVRLTDASPMFSNVAFVGLKGSYGGAVYCSGASFPDFQLCRFEGNYAAAVGGAVACQGGTSPYFYLCLFVDNVAEATGGTIHATGGATPALQECTIVGGDAALGSGLSSWDTVGMMLDQVILVDGLRGAAWAGDSDSAPLIACSDIYGNEGGDWVGALAPMEGMDNNISADPFFCYAFDEANPYTLKDISPCSADANPGCGTIGAFAVNCDVVSPVPGPDGLPLVSRLHPSYPNPFNPRTTIKFDLHKAGHLDLSVFDVSGRLVQRLVNRTMAAGQYDAVWEGRDDSGRLTAAGVYFFRLKTSDTIDTKRMTLIK